MIVVQGTEGAAAAGPLVSLRRLVSVWLAWPLTGATPLGTGVGPSVMLDGIFVTMPGFWGTQAAQRPVKHERPAWTSVEEEPHA